MNVASPFSLSGKRILVTGASSGLGRQIAIVCAASGAQMVICGRNSDRLQESLSQLAGEGHVTITGDLTDDAVIASTVESAGSIDGVVHCTGISIPMPARMARREFVERLYNINVFTPQLLTNQLLARNKINRNGSILFMSSSAAVRGVHGTSIYAGTKAALIAAARCIALETAKRGIRVNCLAPDLVETPMLYGSGANMPTDQWLEEQRAIHPLGLGTPDDVANAAVFFLSPASRWITGTTLIMDGGITH
ncbi:SDR family NAD(P)-dependent oxidoreductase [Xylophilus ampelinus]|uniref:NAD(P)-dependent dehydrogenase (Short-subunit alcohol dehydrogenase family) n=1 Tax=Xylophilus ampelinus TaxID=54067 RepID=A0A318SJV1_9BURK|nr:SDR family oxidoreductase [Xylophilus ampelinus]MCS4511202.1 SDR family oxidoreductase [Xylophilus ampelinus]PYE75043.1 NAD(P)-dependent dehydrogenase (short-subunit alcohol dehydrogenase family) [Xylophilus ampelinus]